MTSAPPGWLPGPGTKPEAVIREARRRQRRRWLAAGVATAAVVAGAGAVIAGSGGGGRPRPPGRHAAATAKPAPGLVLDGNAPNRADQGPALEQGRLWVHPRGGRLVGSARPGWPGVPSHVRGAACAELLCR
jgi:hypothetical protein